MGFSSEAIFIKPGLTDKQELEILESLGFKDYVFNSETSFDEADTRNRFGVYFGKCNGATYLIYDGVYSTERNANNLTKIESILADKLNSHEFLSIMNYETSNSYSYHYIKNGKTVRLKEGYHPDVAEDIGEELEIEKEYYIKKEEVDGVQFYYTKSSYKPEELDKWTHDQIGGSIAFELVKMITGVSYHHDDLFNSKARQYIPKNIVDGIVNAFRGNNTEVIDNSELRDYFPVEYFKEVYNKIQLRLFENGFKESEDWIFQKDNNGIRYSISFKPYKQGFHLIKPSFTFKIEAFQGDWFKKTFGRELNRFGNKMTNDTQIDIQKVGIKDEYFSIFTDQHRYNFNILISLINKRFDEVIFPFFDKVDSLETIAEYNESLPKLDFLLMAGNKEKGEEVLMNTIATVAIYAKDSKWTEEKILNGIAELQDRANLIRTDINVNDIFLSAYNKYEVEMPKEKISNMESVSPENQKVDNKSKKWWKFW